MSEPLNYFVRTTGVDSSELRFKPGTRLKCEYDGRVVDVIVTSDDGFTVEFEPDWATHVDLEDES